MNNLFNKILNLKIEIVISIITLLVLVITLIVNIVFENRKIRRKIKFTNYEVQEDTNSRGNIKFTWVRVDVSNIAQRVVKIKNVYAVTKNGILSQDRSYDKLLEDADDTTLACVFENEKSFTKNDIRMIVVTDSENCIYKGYIYNGCIRNNWIFML